MLSYYICMHPILSDRHHLLLFSLYRFAFFALVSLLHLCCYRRAVLTNLLVVAGIQGVDPGLHRLQWSLNCTESCGAYTEQWQTDSSDLVRRTGLELVSVRGIPIVLHWISLQSPNCNPPAPRLVIEGVLQISRAWRPGIHIDSFSAITPTNRRKCCPLARPAVDVYGYTAATSQPCPDKQSSDVLLDRSLRHSFSRL